MSDTYQLFNLATMSGVFPGTRTMVYQRMRLRALRDEQSTAWARLLWYDDPSACVVELETRAAGGKGVEMTPLLRIPEPGGAGFGRTLQAALAAAGWQMLACGACAHWRPLTAAAPDRPATGSCDRRGAVDDFPTLLAAQSLLALACPHWQPGVEQAAQAPSAEVELAPMPKRAERESDERWTLVGQVRRWLRRNESPAAQGLPAAWADRIVERSGVGAGTEPCFACQGRIANLGALAVATPEGDKQTFSVWRCRQCYTYYLNDWIDRWERTDNLETEERYYRLSPAEALEVLAVIENVVHAEHPARRHERDAQRQWVLDFLAGRPVLSHQIRQGR